MSRETKLRNLILDRYTSLRQFAIEADIPYSTLMTLLSRDVGGASFDVIIKICKKLGVDPMEFYTISNLLFTTIYPKSVDAKLPCDFAYSPC